MEPWKKSSYDGLWTAVSRRAFGRNEVSCLLESVSGNGVRSITLECEFYQRGYKQDEMLELFSNAARALHESAPEALFAKILEQEAWSDERWQLRRVPHDSGGYDLRFSSLDLQLPLPEFSITRDVANGSGKRSVNVILPGEVSEGELRLIGTSIQAAAPKLARTFIVYHVDGMDQNGAAWATTHFDPDLELEILGLTQGDMGRLSSPSHEVATSVIEAWLDKTPFSGGRIELHLEEEGYLFVQQFADGSSLQKAVTGSQTSSGVRYDLVEENSFGEYFVVNRKGDLEAWDREGLISTAAKIQ